jgi:dTDP-4-dehydrorhamnose reductase
MLLITGVSGLLGRGLASRCIEKQIPYVGTYFSRKLPNSFCINYNDEEEVRRFLKEHLITTCVNCMVERQVDVCETDWERTKMVNIDMVDVLARVCHELNIYLIHISTDYVFDGKNVPNYPQSEVNPLQNYGISKLISEKRVLSHLLQYTILRVPVLYTDSVENLSENAVSIIGRKVLNQVEQWKEDDYSIRRPVYIPDFCEFIMSFLHQPRYGIYHFYHPHTKTTKYQMATKIGVLLRMPTTHIKPIVSFDNQASRPYDTELRDKQYDILNFYHTSLRDGLAKCFQKWNMPKIMDTREKGKLFILMDLDGTILDTDRIHYRAYQRAFADYDITLSWSDFDRAINTIGMEEYIRSYPIPWADVRQKKKQYMLEDTDIEFIAGVQQVIEHIITYDLNVVIVTNTSKDIVEHYKQQQPILQKIQQWITREDYTNPKPHSECYEFAIQRYYQNEPYKIGFENTMTGYKSLKNCVDMIYMIMNKQTISYSMMKKEDVYLLPSFVPYL